MNNNTGSNILLIFGGFVVGLLVGGAGVYYALQKNNIAGMESVIENTNQASSSENTQENIFNNTQTDYSTSTTNSTLENKPANSNLKTYTDTQHGFSFQYPTEFVVEKTTEKFYNESTQTFNIIQVLNITNKNAKEEPKIMIKGGFFGGVMPYNGYSYKVDNNSKNELNIQSSLKQDAGPDGNNQYTQIYVDGLGNLDINEVKFITAGFKNNGKNYEPIIKGIIESIKNN